MAKLKIERVENKNMAKTSKVKGNSIDVESVENEKPVSASGSRSGSARKMGPQGSFSNKRRNPAEEQKRKERLKEEQLKKQEKEKKEREDRQR